MTGVASAKTNSRLFALASSQRDLPITDHRQRVRRFALLSTASGALIAFGTCAGAAVRPVNAHAVAPSRMAMATRRQPLLGFLQAANSSVALARLDPLSLRPVSRRVEVGEYHQAWSLSPGGAQLAVARGGQGIGIDIVDLGTMKLVRQIHTGIAAEALGWLASRRLVAGLQRGGTVLIDPRSGRILRRWPRYSFPDASARVRNALVMLLPRLQQSSPNLPLTRVAGAPRLAVVDTQGRLRSVTLKRVRLGVRSRNGISDYYADRAGLAVDPGQARAYVVAADAPVAEVDLRTMRVSYHRLAPMYLREPKNAVLARERGALWLQNGHLVVFGRDFVTTPGRREAALVPAGATVVSAANWRWRTLDSRTTGAAILDGRVVVFGPGWYPAAGVGLRAYTLGGRRVFYLFKGKRVFELQVAAGLAYVRTPSAVAVVDGKSGNVVHRIVPSVDLVDVVVRPS